MSDFDDTTNGPFSTHPLSRYPEPKDMNELVKYRLDELYRSHLQLQKKMEEDEKKYNQKIEDLEKYIQNREQERAKEEARRMKTAIGFLGSMLLAVLGVIWNFRGTIFRGTGQ